MKIIINQDKLHKAITTVEKFISKNPTLPILGNILLKTENNRLKITATNLEIGINYFLNTKIDEVGEITIPARLLSDFISNLSNEKITLISKNNILHINTQSFKTQILGSDSKDFPIIPKVNSNNVIIINSKNLKSGLNTVLDSIATSESRPELTGVFIQFNDSMLTLAATDSFRLAERVLEVKNKNNLSFILPRVTVVELIKILNEVEDDVSIKYNDNQVLFYNNDMEIVSRLIDGNYPDYKKVIPDKYISKLIVKKNELEKNIRMAGIFSSSVSDIKISCDNKSVSVYSKNSDKGEIQTEINAVLKNDPFDIAVNYYYLLDGLKIIPTENVVIEYTGQGSPLVMKPEYDNKNITYLIMPLRR